MATTTNSLAFERSSQPIFAGVADAFASFRAARRERNRIERELNAYSDAELRELGLFRGDIPAIAAGSFRR